MAIATKNIKDLCWAECIEKSCLSWSSVFTKLLQRFIYE